MDMFGFLVYPAGLLLIALMAIGYSPMKGGHGFLLIHGDGRLSTTVDGFTTTITDGCGFRIMSGVRGG